jgi:hypothetical protein
MLAGCFEDHAIGREFSDQRATVYHAGARPQRSRPKRAVPMLDQVVSTAMQHVAGQLSKAELTRIEDECIGEA